MAASFSARASGAGSVHPEKVPGSFFDAIIEVTAGTADYPTGGYAFGVTQLQSVFGNAYSTLESVDVVNHWCNANSGTTAYIAVYNKTSGKLQAFASSGTLGNAFPELSAANAGLNGLICSLRCRFC